MIRKRDVHSRFSRIARLSLLLFLSPITWGHEAQTTPLGRGVYFHVGEVPAYFTNNGERRQRYDSSSLRLGLVLRPPADSSELVTGMELRRVRWPATQSTVAPFLVWADERQTFEIGVTTRKQLMLGWWLRF